MMNITQYDLDLTLQQVINLRVRIDVYDNNMTYIDTIDCGLLSGSSSIDSSSDVRRTCSFVLYPMKDVGTLIDEDSLIWINRNIVLYVGIREMRTEEYTYYKLGTFKIMSYASTYDSVTNQLTINCSDWISILDGTKNGQLHALTTSFPAYVEYDDMLSDIQSIMSSVSYSDNSYALTPPNTYTELKDNDFIIFQVNHTNDNNSPTIYLLNTSFTIVKENGGVIYASELINNTYIVVKLQLQGHKARLTNILNEAPGNGVPLQHNIIRDAMIRTLTDLGGITKYNIDDIGEYKGIEEYNLDYMEYRKKYPLWNSIPYDLDFSAGDNILSILTTFRDLYPNYEIYFDEDGIFNCHMIPSFIDDTYFLTNDYLQQILISENYNIDTSSVKNVCEVFGQSVDTNFTSESCTLSNDTYQINVKDYLTPKYQTYMTGDYIAVTIDNPNPSNSKFQIITTWHDENNQTHTTTLPALTILDDMTSKKLDSNTLEADTMYVFKIETFNENDVPVKYAVLLCSFQPQGINILTNKTQMEHDRGLVSDETTTFPSGHTYKKWSTDWFKEFYGCKKIEYSFIPYSPFTIQKLGLLLDVKTGGEFDNIESDSLALGRAEYENWKNARLTDNISLVLKLCPFLDVNKKVTYKRSDKNDEDTYIISSVSHDFSGGTTSISMYKFYPLYRNDPFALNYTAFSVDTNSDLWLDTINLILLNLFELDSNCNLYCLDEQLANMLEFDAITGNMYFVV